MQAAAWPGRCSGVARSGRRESARYARTSGIQPARRRSHRAQEDDGRKRSESESTFRELQRDGLFNRPTAQVALNARVRKSTLEMGRGGYQFEVFSGCGALWKRRLGRFSAVPAGVEWVGRSERTVEWLKAIRRSCGFLADALEVLQIFEPPRTPRNTGMLKPPMGADQRRYFLLAFICVHRRFLNSSVFPWPSRRPWRLVF